MWGTVWGPDEEAFPIGLTLEHETAKAKANRPPPPPPLSLFFLGRLGPAGPTVTASDVPRHLHLHPCDSWRSLIAYLFIHFAVSLAIN